MTNYIKVNDKDRCLVMDRTFEKKSKIVGSEEYNMLQQARKDYPNYSVVRRQIKKKADQERYKGLTYEYMEDYILDHEPRATKNEVHDKFREMIDISKCHSRRYPIIKSWFLEKYPEVKKYGTKAADECYLVDTEMIA